MTKTLSPSRRVPARYLQLLMQCLQEFGVDRAQVLARAQLEPQRLQGRDAMVSHPEVDRLIRAAARTSGRPDLAFEFGQRIRLNAHDLLGYGLMCCPSLDGFLRMASRHYHLMVETWTLRYHRWPQAGEAVYAPLLALSPLGLQFYLETLAMAHHQQMQQLLGTAPYACDYFLSMPPPAHVQRYRALAGARFHFQAGGPPCLRVLMPAAVLDHPLPLANEDVMRDIDQRCAALGRVVPPGRQGWASYILAVLRQAQGAPPTLEDMARRARVSARTLERYLHKDGLGYRALADKVRFERACELLCQPGSSVAEVAHTLGFSDAANFSRAFKRVLGSTPGQYQRSTTVAR